MFSFFLSSRDVAKIIIPTPTTPSHSLKPSIHPPPRGRPSKCYRISVSVATVLGPPTPTPPAGSLLATSPREIGTTQFFVTVSQITAATCPPLPPADFPPTNSPNFPPGSTPSPLNFSNSHFYATHLTLAQSHFHCYDWIITNLGVPWFRRGTLRMSGRVQVDRHGPGKKAIKN